MTSQAQAQHIPILQGRDVCDRGPPGVRGLSDAVSPGKSAAVGDLIETLADAGVDSEAGVAVE